MIRARLLLAALLACASGCERAAPPNLLLITLDTTRADRLGPYAGPAATPALDRFAREAVVYERAWSSSSWTLPSHASLFTGLLPLQHGAQTAPGGDVRTLDYSVRPLAERFDTLAERLRAAGYRTAAVIGGPALRRELGVAQGFEHYDDGLRGPALLVGRRAHDVAEHAIAQLAQSGAGPWLLFVNFFDPHAPYAPPPPWDRGLVAVDEQRLHRAQLERLVAGRPAEPAPWERESNGRLLARYDAEIAYMDSELGRLLDALAASAGGARTLVAITSDHGESFGEHDYFSHGAHLYEDNVRVPLLLRRPDGAGAGTRVAAPVPSHALFAELLAAAGLVPPPGVPRLDGRAAVLTEVGASDANVRHLGPFFDRSLRAFYAFPYKWIESSRGAGELYDLAADPRELDDLASREPERSAELRARLSAAVAALPPLYDAGARAEISEETEQALRALGYLGDAGE